MATYNSQQRRPGLRSWSRGRWIVASLVLVAIVVVVVVLLTYTGSGGGGGGY